MLKTLLAAATALSFVACTNSTDATTASKSRSEKIHCAISPVAISVVLDSDFKTNFPSTATLEHGAGNFPMERMKLNSESEQEQTELVYRTIPSQSKGLITQVEINLKRNELRAFSIDTPELETTVSLSSCSPTGR